MSDAVLKYGEPENYVNRELSWLEFNYRILGEARDKTTPLFERLKFLSITASNLDEFFMVRVASLKDMVHAGYKKPDIAGMTAQEQLDKMHAQGLDPEDFKYYLEAHKYGLPPHGGLGIGLERLVMKLLGLSNVRQASMFPRDINRLLP